MITEIGTKVPRTESAAEKGIAIMPRRDRSHEKDEGYE